MTVEALPQLETLDLSEATLREANQRLHDAEAGRFRIVNPNGAHAVAWEPEPGRVYSWGAAPVAA